MSTETNQLVPNTSDTNGARFQYYVTPEKGGWVNRYVLLQTGTMSPMEAHDPSAGQLPLVFDTTDDAEKFKNGLAENIAEIIQASSGMTFEQSLQFAKAESTDRLIVATPANGTMSIDQDVYIVHF